MQRTPAGIRRPGLGNSNRTPKLALAASMTRSTATTLAARRTAPVRSARPLTAWPIRTRFQAALAMAALQPLKSRLLRCRPRCRRRRKPIRAPPSARRSRPNCRAWTCITNPTTRPAPTRADDAPCAPLAKTSARSWTTRLAPSLLNAKCATGGPARADGSHCVRVGCRCRGKFGGV